MEKLGYWDRKIVVGDLVAIKPNYMEVYYHHLDSDNDIPNQNYGKVVKVVSANDKDEKGRYLHPKPHNHMYGRQDYLTLEFESGELFNVFSGSVLLLTAYK